MAETGTYLSVRFGNVLGSRGSVLPAFRSMIEAGGPVTVTDPMVTRFFMTIPESVELVIQAGAIGGPGEVLILDMGSPIRIDDVARMLIHESGRDIEITYTGLRPGEKLSDYQRMTIRLPPDVRAELDAAGYVLGRPQWRVLVDAIRAYVNEALFFSRTHALKLKRTDLNETVKATADLVAADAQRKNIRLSIDGAARADVEIDEVLIQRLLCNLLSNAIDATPVGSAIRIEVTPLPRTERNREWYRLSVKDTGSGISPENLKRVFMPYFSTKNTGDRRRGFGLGLAIARKIVHLHGGNMVITSEQNKGTTVQVDLPNRPPADAGKISQSLAVEFAT